MTPDEMQRWLFRPRRPEFAGQTRSELWRGRPCLVSYDSAGRVSYIKVPILLGEGDDHVN